MKKSLIKKIAALVSAGFAALLMLASALPAPQRTAGAASVTYTDVMDDLRSCENFTTADYPSNATDYTLEVIQIAESENGELFLYVYQPSDAAKEIQAATVNISTTETGENGYVTYGLKLLSTSSVFDKYRVEGFAVNADATLRYYNISSISRPYDADIDAALAAGNTASTVACAVGQAWEAYTYNGEVLYSCEHLEVIQIDSKHVGFIRYQDLKLFGDGSYTDSHYVAFATNRPIDSLLEAEISFYYQDFDAFRDPKTITDSTPVYDEEATSEKTFVKKKLLASDVFSKESKWFDDYEYNRIQSTEEFLANETEEFTSDVQAALEQTDWVLRFFESEYGEIGDALGVSQKWYTTVSDVTILSLRYTYLGEIYSLGVVDNAQTGSTSPDNDDWDKNEPDNILDGLTPDWFDKWWNDLKETTQKILRTVIIVALVVFVIWICSKLFRKKNK